MKKFLKISFVIFIGFLIFIGGMIVGNKYQISDFLCPGMAEPFVLQEDLATKDGIFFPKGTIIPLRQCAYMQRFKWHFAIDNSVKLKMATDVSGQDYGFSELIKSN